MPGKLAYIDALRGWAILAVIAVHSSTWVPADTPWLHTIASQGAVGVQLFYLVSAFTLLLSWEGRKSEPRALRNYFIRRFFRVAPLFYIAILVYGPLRDTLTPRYWLMPEGVQAWHYVTAFTFTHDWHPISANALVPGGWSMGVEMTFYLVFPLLVAWITSLRRAVVFTVIALVAGMLISRLADWWFSPLLPERHHFYIANFAYTYIPTAQLCVFGLGFILFWWQKQLGHVTPPGSRALLQIAGGLIAVLALAFWKLPQVPGFFQFSIAFMVIAMGLSARPLRPIVNRVTRRIGELSYSIYLIHFGAIYLLKLVSPGFELSGNRTVDFLLAFLAVTLLTSALAWISYHVIERPGIRLGRRVIARLEDKSRQSGRDDVPSE